MSPVQKISALLNSRYPLTVLKDSVTSEFKQKCKYEKGDNGLKVK